MKLEQIRRLRREQTPQTERHKTLGEYEKIPSGFKAIGWLAKLYPFRFVTGGATKKDVLEDYLAYQRGGEIMAQAITKEYKEFKEEPGWQKVGRFTPANVLELASMPEHIKEAKANVAAENYGAGDGPMEELIYQTTRRLPGMAANAAGLFGAGSIKPQMEDMAYEAPGTFAGRVGAAVGGGLEFGAGLASWPGRLIGGAKQAGKIAHMMRKGLVATTLSNARKAHPTVGGFMKDYGTYMGLMSAAGLFRAGATKVFAGGGAKYGAQVANAADKGGLFKRAVKGALSKGGAAGKYLVVDRADDWMESVADSTYFAWKARPEGTSFMEAFLGSLPSTLALNYLQESAADGFSVGNLVNRTEQEWRKGQGRDLPGADVEKARERIRADIIEPLFQDTVTAWRKMEDLELDDKQKEKIDEYQRVLSSATEFRNADENNSQYVGQMFKFLGELRAEVDKRGLEKVREAKKEFYEQTSQLKDRIQDITPKNIFEWLVDEFEIDVKTKGEAKEDDPLWGVLEETEALHNHGRETFSESEKPWLAVPFLALEESMDDPDRFWQASEALRIVSTPKRSVSGLKQAEETLKKLAPTFFEKVMEYRELAKPAYRAVAQQFDIDTNEYELHVWPMVRGAVPKGFVEQSTVFGYGTLPEVSQYRRNELEARHSRIRSQHPAFYKQLAAMVGLSGRAQPKTLTDRLLNQRLDETFVHELFHETNEGAYLLAAGRGATKWTDTLDFLGKVEEYYAEFSEEGVQPTEAAEQAGILKAAFDLKVHTGVGAFALDKVLAGETELGEDIEYVKTEKEDRLVRQSDGKYWKITKFPLPQVLPKARQLAMMEGLDLNKIKGTGIGEHVRLKDVKKAARARDRGQDTAKDKLKKVLETKLDKMTGPYAERLRELRQTAEEDPTLKEAEAMLDLAEQVVEQGVKAKSEFVAKQEKQLEEDLNQTLQEGGTTEMSLADALVHGDEAKSSGTLKWLVSGANYNLEHLMLKVFGKDSLAWDIFHGNFTQALSNKYSYLKTLRQQYQEALQGAFQKRGLEFDEEAMAKMTNTIEGDTERRWLDLPSGARIHVTPGQLISMALTAEDADGREQILSPDGLRVYDRKGHNKSGKEKSVKDADGKNVSLTVEDRDALWNNLTAEEQAHAEAIATIMQGPTRKIREELSFRTKGTFEAMVENYWPLQVDHDYVDVKMEPIKEGQQAFERPSFEKVSWRIRRKNHGKPLLIHDAFEVFNKALVETAAVSAYAEPMLRAKRLVNSDEFQKAIKNTYGQKLLLDMQDMLGRIEDTSVRRDVVGSLAQKVLSKGAGSILVSHPAIWGKQVFSVSLAYGSEVNGSKITMADLSKGVANAAANWKKYSQKIKDLSPWLSHRMEHGKATREIGRLTNADDMTYWFMGKRSLGEKMARGLTKGDSAALVILASIVDSKTAAGDSEAFAAELENLVARTQPCWEQQFRSALGGNPSNLTTFLTPFHTFRSKVIQSVSRTHWEHQQGKISGREKWKRILAFLGATYLTQALFRHGRKAIKAAAYGDEEQYRNFGDAAKDEFLAGIGDLGGLFYVMDIGVGPLTASLQYDMELQPSASPAMQTFAELIGTSYETVNAIADNPLSEEGKKHGRRALEKAMTLTARIVGPVGAPLEAGSGILKDIRQAKSQDKKVRSHIKRTDLRLREEELEKMELILEE